jgi:EpsI family protein
LHGKRTAVTTAEIVSGQRRRLVWSFYVVGGRITTRLIEAKLLQASAVLLEREPVAAFVAISASMGDPIDPAEGQLTRFLAASEPFPEYIESLPR